MHNTAAEFEVTYSSNLHFLVTAHYWKFRLCEEPETLGKGPQTLGKAFAGSSTRQRADGNFFLGHVSLPSTLAPGYRHRLCREPIVGRRPKKVAVNGGLG
jgi:hypothetical protein